jgi:probable HAF family extracellular repeat protein
VRIHHPGPERLRLPVLGLFLLAIGCGSQSSGDGLTDPAQQARIKPPAAPSYVGQDLGVLPGDNQSTGFGVNSAGQVVGQSASGTGGVRGFYWDGTMHNLTTPGAQGVALAISSGSTAYAVGYERASGADNRAVRWTLPSLTPATLEAGPSSAYGVNDAGTAVGTYCVSDCGAPANIWHGAIWSAGGSRTDIGPLPGYFHAYASDINNDGLVVGSSNRIGLDQQGYLRLSTGVLVALPPLAPFPYSDANSVSNVVGGLVYVAGFSRDESREGEALRWTVDVSTGQVTETLVLNQRWADGVNDAGGVAGTGGSSQSPAATLWRDGVYSALKAPKGAKGSVSRGMSRAVGTPSYVVGETKVQNWPRALRWVIQ